MSALREHNATLDHRWRTTGKRVSNASLAPTSQPDPGTLWEANHAIKRVSNASLAPTSQPDPGLLWEANHAPLAPTSQPDPCTLWEANHAIKRVSNASLATDYYWYLFVAYVG